MNDANAKPIREAVGIFFNTDHLQQTIEALTAAGFKPEQLRLLASEYAVQESLGDLYTEINEAAEQHQSSAPHVSFVKERSIGDTAHGLVGGIVFVGSCAIGGVAVWTAALLGGALATAIAGGAAVGAVGGAMAYILRQSDAEYLAESVDEGHLLLFVRTADEKQERKAVEILSQHAAYDARIHEVPEDSVKPGQTTGQQAKDKQDTEKQAWII